MTKRASIVLDDDEYELLKKIAKLEGIPRNRVLRRGLKLYAGLMILLRRPDILAKLLEE